MTNSRVVSNLEAKTEQVVGETGLQENAVPKIVITSGQVESFDDTHPVNSVNLTSHKFRESNEHSKSKNNIKTLTSKLSL